MAKQLNVSLNVSADTREAKQKFNELQQLLTKLQTDVKLNVDDSSLKEAREAAGDLQKHLSTAVNTDTGKLDLNKFSQSLNKSGQDLKGLYNKLSQIGPAGQQAFFKVAQSIAAADSSALSLGSRIKELGTTLMNTARWQVSSSILHGLMGAVQGAYGYAEKLNKSLNNIRIVTGKSTDEMARFAQEANSAAKALSTTTTDYTDAALIYYQQGIRNQQEIAERVETTIKLANVTRQSADEVSNQMTAIWNNFYDGSKTLEYYADVITALGASTASSSEEISTGLEKFSAIASTVGLSYEYATAALATVTATTRQSADIVGTAFKTLFARIQDLELGKTLDDGTTLGKYSQALATIGVSIKDANGEVKQMDDILDDLGDKWKTISKDQQIALAETVAGTRQYAQLVALMDNWDFMKENIQTAKDAEGTLQEQADIYAESWEAARDRVTAAAEEIYSKLLNDKFFISILSGFEKFLSLISNVIDGLGGLKGSLLLISSIIMQNYAKEMPRILSDLGSNFAVITGQAEKKKQELLRDASEALNLVPILGQGEANGKEGVSLILEMTQKLNAAQKNMSETEIEAYKHKIELVKSYTDTAAAIGKEIDALNKETSALKLNFEASAKAAVEEAKLKHKKDTTERTKMNKVNGQEKSWQQQNAERGAKASKQNRIIDNANKDIEALTTKENALKLENKTADTDRKKQISLELEQIRQQRAALKKEMQAAQAEYDKLQKEITATRERAYQLEEEINNSEAVIAAGKKVQQSIDELGILSQNLGKMQAVTEAVNERIGVWKNAVTQANGDKEKLKSVTEQILLYADAMDDAGIDTTKLRTALKDGKLDDAFTILENSVKETGQEIDTTKTKIADLKQQLGEDFKIDSTKLEQYSNQWVQVGKNAVQASAAMDAARKKADEKPKSDIPLSESFTKLASKIMQVTTLINSFTNLIDVWNNKDLTTGQKLIQTFTALATIIPIVTNVFNKDTLKTLSNIAIKMKLIPVNAGVAASEVAVGTAAAFALGYFILIAAAIAALVLGIKALVDWWNADAIAAEKAKKTAQELTEAYNDTKQAYENLKQSIADYTDAKNGLDQLIKGTQEWRDAIIDTNEKALELINTYNLKQGKDYSMKNGVISITDEALNNIQRIEQQNLLQSQASQISAKNYAIKANNAANITAYGRKTNHLHFGELARYAAFGPVGGIVGGLINEGIQSTENTKQIETAIQRLTSGDLAKEFAQGLSNEDLISKLGLEKLETSNNDLASHITQLANETAQAAENTRLNSQAIADAILAINGIEDSPYTDQISAMSGNQVNKIENSGLFERTKNTYDVYFSDFINRMAYGDRKVKEYFEQNEHFKQIGAHLGGWDDSRKAYTYTYQDGNETKTGYLSSADIAAGIVSEQEQKVVENTSKALTEYFDAHGNVANNKALMSLLGSTSLDNSVVASDLSYNDLINSDTSGFNIDETLLNLMGLSEEEWQARVSSFQNNSQEAWTAVLGKAGNGLIKRTLKDSSLSTAQKYAAYDSWINPGLTTLLKAVDEEDQSAVFEKLMGLNWSDWDVYRQAQQILASFGVQIDLTAENYQNLIHVQHQATNAVRDFTKLKTDVAAMSDALSGLDFGKSVKEDIYQTLAGYDFNWANSNFILGADGQYTYLGTAQEAHEKLLQFLIDEKNLYFENNENTKEYQEYLEQIASTAQDLIELQSLYDQGIINEQAYIKQSILLQKQFEAATAEHIALLNEEIDRYHALDKELETLAKYQSYVNKLSSTRVGESRIIALNKENDLLAKQIRLEEQYMEKAGQYRDNDYSALLFGKTQGLTHDGKTYDQYGLNNFGISSDMLQLDQYGTITNYADIMRKLKNNFDIQWKAANEEGKALLTAQYEGISQLLSQYEESANLYLDKVFELENLKHEQLSKNYQILSTKFEKDLKLIDNELKQVDYSLKRIGNDAFRAVEALSKLFTNEPGSQDKAHLLVDQMQTLMGQVDELEESWRSGQIEDSDYYSSLENLQSQLYGVYDAWADLDEQMKSYYSDTMDKAMEKVNQLTDAMAHNMEVIQHLQNILALTGGETDYKTLGRILQARFEMAEDELQVATAEKEMWAKQLEAAIANGNSEEELAYIQQKAFESESKYYDKLTSYLEAGEAVRDNAFKQWTTEREKTLTNGMGWDFLNKMMDIAEKTDNKYLTKTNQMYETNKMLRDIENEISKTSSQNAKQELNNFAEKIKSLQNMNKLNKDAWELAKAQYNIEKARLALEEAKDAKTTVRLQRDNEGNYGYVYTADVDKINNLEQQLADAENNYYNLAREQDANAYKELIQVTQDYWSERDKLDYDYHVKHLYTEEEYNKKRLELDSKYEGYLTAITENSLLDRAVLEEASITQANDTWTEQFNEYRSGNLAILNAANSDYALMFGALTSQRSGWFNTENPEWEKFYTGIFKTAEANRILINGEFTAMTGACDASIKAMTSALGVDENSGLRGIWAKVSEAVEAAKNKNEEYKNKLIGEDGLITQVDNLGTSILGVTSAWTSFCNYIDTTLLTKLDTTTSHVKDLITEILNLKREIGDFPDGTSGNNKTPGVGGSKHDDRNIVDAGVGTGPSGSKGSGEELSPPEHYNESVDEDTLRMILSNNGEVTLRPYAVRVYQKVIDADGTKHFDFTGVQQRYDSFHEANQAAQNYRTTYPQYANSSYIIGLFEWLKDQSQWKELARYNTGGYTGSWPGGSQLENGRLAMLHQKELVLNQDDTANMLAAVSIIRDIVQQIDLRAAMANISSSLASPNYGGLSSTLEQQVTIHAEFPNATNHSEIEEAFDNLINRASQYANRF